ncbi:hypothetical protein C0992_006916, partial [Termitomyces sp. T32_za158]
PQTSTIVMVNPMEGAVPPPDTHEGANIASTTADQTEISQESFKVSEVMSAAGTFSTGPGNLPGSKAKDGLKTAWNGLKMILGCVERIERRLGIVEAYLHSDDTTDMVSTKMKEDFARCA